MKVSESEKIANCTGDWRKALAAYKGGPMDWLGMEATLRAFIKETNNRDLDEIVAGFTRRGHVLPEEYQDAEQTQGSFNRTC